MKKRFETCDVTLTPISPIHISAGNPDYGWGVVWLEKQEKMFILDSDRFSQELIEHNLFEKYIENVEEWIQLQDSEKEKQANPCLRFLQNNKQHIFPNIDIQTFVKGLSVAEITAPNSTRFIRNGEGFAYIPGSSIKGAIRTALVYAMLKEHMIRTKNDYLNDTYLKNVFDGKQIVPNDTNSGFNIRKGMDKELLESVLEDFELTEKDDAKNSILFNRPRPYNGSITNLMRAILVSDSTPIPHMQSNLVDEDVKIIMLKNPDKYGDRDLNRQTLDYAVNSNKKQCYEPNQKSAITFKITIDHEILRSFFEATSDKKFQIIFQNISDIRKIINTFFTQVWENELLFYFDDLKIDEGSVEDKLVGKILSFYDTNDSNTLSKINIGLGSGVLCKTLFISIKEEYRKKIRNLQMTQRQIDNQKRGVNGRGNIVDWINKIAPNSRHLVFRQSGNYSNAYRPLGWANLKFGPITYEDNAL
ncbi:MAG: type III-A CRISPR-associated RAMP protein Csm5 [Chlorobiaceae bacterium]|nr:type III-A CRISPR-associated RAMP protein Csm5 [Chlorobiaceae bacterium]